MIHPPKQDESQIKTQGNPSRFRFCVGRFKEPLSQRALEDARQTELIQQAWTDSDKVYGYRKLADDLRDAGETC